MSENVVELRAGGKLDAKLDVAEMVLEIVRGDRVHRYFLADARRGRLVVERLCVVAGLTLLLDRTEKIVPVRGGDVGG